MWIGKGIRRLAKPDGRCHIGNKVEGIKESEMVDISCIVNTGDEYHTKYRNTEGNDQHKHRYAKASNDEKEGGVIHALSL